MNGQEISSKHRLSSKKLWAFRLLAILIVLLPFLIWETTLRAIHWHPKTSIGDPFVDFLNVRPLFIAQDDNQQYVTAPDRLEYFQSDSFGITKQADEFRIFFLGGSTVQGRPYSIETSMTSWLKLSLQAADSSRQWEVVNCGGVSYASYRLVPILEEILRYEPDLIILCTGHNEFLEERSYAGIKHAPQFVAKSYQTLAQLRSMQFVHQMFIENSGSNQNVTPQILADDVDALLDYQGGLEDYHRDTKLRQNVIAHFEYNLRRMVDLIQKTDVPLFIVHPPSNLVDCPPFKSENSSGISAADRSMCESFTVKANEVMDDNPQRAIEFLQKAIALNEQHAGLHYQLGLLLFDVKKFSEAKYQFQKAKDEDICPLRIIEPVIEVIRQVALEKNVALLDLQRKFESLSEGEIPGENLFVDHVHPTFRGHQVIAEQIMRLLESKQIVKPADNWTDRRDALYLQHWDSLEPIYFERGRQRLEGLSKWSQGRAKKLRLPVEGTSQDQRN